MRAVVLVVAVALLGLPVVVAAPASAADCRGFKRVDVEGQNPAYTRKKLTIYPNHKAACRGTWLPQPRRYMVPQGLAMDGSASWIAGYHYRPGIGKRPCRISKVLRKNGRLLAYKRVVTGRVGKRPSSYCRHGGGILSRKGRLWIVEKNKLWFVNPRQGSSLRAWRVWRIHRPIAGSAVVATRRTIGIVPFATRGRPHIYWFKFSKLMRRGVTDLVPRKRRSGQLGAGHRTRVPTDVQGAAFSRGYRHLWLTRSNLACGELVRVGSRRRIGFIPGAEGIRFNTRGDRLWVVSESGARPYQKGRTRLTPTLTSFEWPRLVHGKRSKCRF